MVFSLGILCCFMPAKILNIKEIYIPGTLGAKDCSSALYNQAAP
jgi:hypothetical protein